MSIPARVSLLWHILLSTQVASCSPLPEPPASYVGFEESEPDAYEPLPTESDSSDDSLITDTGTTTLQLAYAYSARLAVPSEAVPPLARRHEASCQEAGTEVCQVISSSVKGLGSDHIQAELTIRAAKPWMTSFRQNLANEASDKGGHLKAMAARAENLSRVITDTAARLNAHQTLRERLVTLLTLETDDISNLLQIEKELTRVQGEIERAESRLRQLNGRVAMDQLRLRYTALPKTIPASAAEPIADALNTFSSTLSQSVALLILFIASASPWILLGMPFLWLIVRILRWAITGRQPVTSPSPTPETFEDLTPEPSVD